MSVPTTTTDNDSDREDRKPRRLSIPWMTAGGLLVVAGALVAWWLVATGDELPDDAAFRVDGRVVTVEDHQRFVAVLEALYGVEPPQEPSARSDFRRDTAKAHALSQLLAEEARRRDLVPAEREVRDTLDRMIEARYPLGGRYTFEEALGSRGVNEAQVIDEVRRQLELRALFSEVTGEVDVDDDDLRVAYDEQREELRIPEQRTIRHVVVAEEAVATEVASRLEGGEDFADLAAEVSLDGSTKEEGGLLGTLTRSQLAPAFGDAAFRADEGTVFGPVRTDLGWHVGRVDEVVPGRTPRFEEVRESLRERLRLDRAVQVWEAWLADQLEEAAIQYADDYRPGDPTAPPSLRLPTSPTEPGPSDAPSDPDGTS